MVPAASFPLPLILLLGVGLVVLALLASLVGEHSPGARRSIGWLILGTLAVGVAIWYLGLYDTAAGKCQRGDLSACAVQQFEEQSP